MKWKIGKALGMNHILEILEFNCYVSSVKLDLEELVQPLIMDKNRHQVNYTLTNLTFLEFSFVNSFHACLAWMMLRKNSLIKHLSLKYSLTSESNAWELIQSLVNNHSLETLHLGWCDGAKDTIVLAIMDVLLKCHLETQIWATLLWKEMASMWPWANN